MDCDRDRWTDNINQYSYPCLVSGSDAAFVFFESVQCLGIHVKVMSCVIGEVARQREGNWRL